jgi:hypothetical protein
VNFQTKGKTEMSDAQNTPGFVEAFRVLAPAPATPWLDCDTSPAIRSRYSKRRRLDAVIRDAEAMLANVDNGQIGIYASAFGGPFFGYVIKDYDRSTRFEAAESTDAA